jgi:hypothetical protein
MRKSTRLVVAALLSVAALGILPAQGAVSATPKPSNVYCCK